MHGMLRLPRSKRSVAKKKALDLYVSRIQLECGCLEVCRTREEADRFLDVEPKRSVSSLQIGEEVTGLVTKLLPYGVMVDVGAN